MDDPRPASAFKTRTYSGHQRVAVRHALLKALTSATLEPACHWTAELVASGLFADVWDTVLLFFGRHVHAGNPRLASYLALRADSFRDLVRAAPTELSLRNTPAAQRLFAEMMCVLCASPKRHPTDIVKVPPSAFVLTELHTKLKAPRGDFAKLLPGDAPEEAVLAVHPQRDVPRRDTVQVYAGRRIDANSLFMRLTDSVGTVLPVVIHFDEPQFKVFVGIYGSRIEAEYALRKWRANFPTSFAVQAPNERFKKTASSN